MDSDNRLVIVIALAVLLYLLYRYQQRVFETSSPPDTSTEDPVPSERPKSKKSPEMIDLESSYEPDSMLDSFDGSDMSSLLQSESPEPSWL